MMGQKKKNVTWFASHWTFMRANVRQSHRYINAPVRSQTLPSLCGVVVGVLVLVGHL